MVSQAASRRNITFVISEAELPTALGRLHDTLLLAGERELMRILLLGHGRMGQLVESLAPVLRRHDRRRNRRAIGRTRDCRRRFRPVDVAIDFTLADAVVKNLPQLAAREDQRRDWHHGLAGARSGHAGMAAQAGIGVLAASNFSLGMNMFQMAVEEASRRFANHAEFGAWLHESHHT